MGEGNGDKVADHRQKAFSDSTLCLLLVAVLFSRLAMWMHSDLWYDEVVTLVDFVMGGTEGHLSHVFRHYPVANNHILFSAIGWVWVRLTGFSLLEPILRLPPLVFSVLTVLAVFKLWQPSLGHRVALFAALTFAASPALSPFYYQFRGYSLTFLLAVPATAGAWEMVQGRVRHGAWLAGFACFLLPLVIPSNLALVAALALFVLVAGSGRPGRRLLAAVAFGLPGLIGGLYYLTIWPQFVRVTQQTSGWASGWQVGGHLLLALLAHCTPVFVVVCAGLLSRSRLVGQARHERWVVLVLVAACSLAVVGCILASRTAPFPRVFAVFFVPLTWALFRFSRHSAFWAGRVLPVAGAILISAFVWERGADLLTRRQLARGEHPQNLLQQYYRGDDGLSRVVGEIIRRELGERVVVLATAHDFPTLNFYWRMGGLPGEEDGPFPGVGLRRVISVSEERRYEDCRRALRQQLVLVSLGTDEKDAARIFGECAQTGQIEALFTIGHRTLYVLHSSGIPLAVPPNPAGRS